VCFIICKTTSKLEHAILTTFYFTDAENTDNTPRHAEPTGLHTVVVTLDVVLYFVMRK
jgi:hypothetical protein